MSPNDDHQPAPLPEGLLLAYYGDDFTGSTDAMEAMTAAGVPTVLFLAPPTPEALQRFPGVRCVGLAGSSRGRSPEWMRAELPQAFASLKALGAPILHYKVCSTFDSSPSLGSIGCAIEIGLQHMGGHWSPTVVGAPRLRRYQVFGHLFAAVDGVGYRLDRHPTMSRHPVTPMGESDLRRHLAAQTPRRMGLVDMVQLKSGDAHAQLTACRQPEADEAGATSPQAEAPIVFIDVLDEDTLLEAGRLVWRQRGQGLFSASSSGLCYALTAYWRSEGWLPAHTALPETQPVSQIAAVSGSCSPVSAAQIRWARAHGFATERLAVAACLQPARREAELQRVLAQAGQALSAGRSALVFSAEGPDDPEVLAFDQHAAQAGLSRTEAARCVGACLAEVMKRLLDQHPLRRIVVAGGDSSGEVASVLGLDALTVLARLTPGAPLCRAWSTHPQRDGLEVVLKGGQMGGESFYGQALHGG
ncbi:four-carbon acid sugar kinase family protein [Curvibacter sp. HBC28]|uniref:Four-carbon acid sugar kinase family protein n=1 Tax=Curvibacter microcysteis TaxID=3026419 RepID=A0ABT5MF22_9BURK|nr:3-oxo-isoapionate kinase OiaK [Curvibacter sp. HBC28]MDD0815031.1 four-carbon acid sugar kinase family protein [Curvibacter sp. HBC28]